MTELEEEMPVLQWPALQKGVQGSKAAALDMNLLPFTEPQYAKIRRNPAGNILKYVGTMQK